MGAQRSAGLPKVTKHEDLLTSSPETNYLGDGRCDLRMARETAHIRKCLLEAIHVPLGCVSAARTVLLWRRFIIHNADGFGVPRRLSRIKVRLVTGGQAFREDCASGSL